MYYVPATSGDKPDAVVVAVSRAERRPPTRSPTRTDPDADAAGSKLTINSRRRSVRH